MKKNWIRLAIVIALVGLAIYMYFNVDMTQWTPEKIGAYIRSQGSFAAVGYVVILSLLPLLLFPDSVIVIAGGMVFGLMQGVILTSIGSLLGGVIAYLLAKWLGRDFVKHFVKKDLVRFTEGASGFFMILILRLVPLFPFKVVSYSAGLAGVNLRSFSLATLVGSLPGIIVYTNIGDKANDVRSTEFVWAIAFLVILTVVCVAMKKVVDKKWKQHEN